MLAYHLNWYKSAHSIVRVSSELSNAFTITRGVKQGSVLPPILFLIATNPSCKSEICKCCCLYSWNLCGGGGGGGGAAHADDLRTIATSKTSVREQINLIEPFTSKQHLKLNHSKTEIIKVSHFCPNHDQINLPSSNINVIAEMPGCLVGIQLIGFAICVRKHYESKEGIWKDRCFPKPEPSFSY